jgi:hypothetical protein
MNRAVRFPSLLAAIACAVAVAAAKSAPPLVTYRLDSADFQILESPSKLSAALGKLVGQPFPDTSHLLEAMRAAFPDAPAVGRSLENIVRGGLPLPSVPNPDTICEYLDDPCPVQSIGIDSPAVRALRKRFVARHKLPDFPPPLLENMKEQIGLAYPEEELLHLALVETISDGLGTCPANLSTSVSQAKSRKISEEDFRAAARQLVPPLPPGSAPTDPTPSLVQLIANYRNRRTPCSMAELEAVQGLVLQIYDSLLRPAVHELASKDHPASPFVPPKWTGKGCGCSLRSLNGTVYGIYPRWSFDTSQHTLDFSLVHRIEFHALTFDKAGVFDDPSTVPGAEAFLDEARKYDVRLDWVLARSDWRGWTEEPADDRREMFRNLSDRIADLLVRRRNGVWNRIRRHIPLFPNSTNSTWGDGVTLYVPGYPSDTLSARLFRDFYRGLVVRLQRTGIPLQVNLLLERPDLERADGLFAYAPLVDLVDFTDSIQMPAGADSFPPPRTIETRFLVLLDAPTMWTKKQLQRGFDFHLHGDARQKFVRALVPVLLHPGTDLERTNADITYFTDNFYGMGFWPLPRVTTPDDPNNPHDRLSELIRTRFSANDSIVPEASAFSTQVCTHRWELRILQFASLLLLAATGAASFFTCRVKHLLEARRLQAGGVLLGSPIALFTTLLFNDPDLASVKAGNAPFGMMTALFVATLAGIGAYLHYRTPKPNRTTLKQAMEKLRGGGEK